MNVITKLISKWRTFRATLRYRRHLAHCAEVASRYTITAYDGNIYLMCRDTAVARYLPTDTVETILMVMRQAIDAALELETKRGSHGQA